MRDPALSEIDRVAHQKAAVSMIGEGDCSGPWQDEYSISEWGHYSAPRGLGGISGRPP